MLARILEAQSLFTLRDLIWQSIGRAKGYRHYHFHELHYCYICGRQRDYFGFTRLIPFFDMSLENKFVYICDDHGRVTNYDCTTGELLELPLPRPYWYRTIRNIIQTIILRVAFILRFAYFFSYSWLMWYVAIWPVFIYRELRRG